MYEFVYDLLMCQNVDCFEDENSNCEVDKQPNLVIKNYRNHSLNPTTLSYLLRKLMC